MRDFDFSSLARANSLAVSCSASIRHQHGSFQVDEVLPFQPDGEGGHVWLKIRKRGINTDWLANELARFAKVPQVAVGYAGLKDRHAVTTMRFSMPMVDQEACGSWSNTSTVTTKPGARTCPAPEQNNECGDCRACWDPEVKNIAYGKH